MKLISFTLSVCLLSVHTVYSQNSLLKEAEQYLTVPAGAQDVDKKVLKEPTAQALPYIALKFRTASVETFQQGKNKNVDKATTYAMLDGVDSSLFQEITNEFSKMFEQKIKEAGITLVELSKIKEAKSYKGYIAENEPRNFNHKNYGTADVYTQDHVPFFYFPNGAMQLIKYGKETGGAPSFLRLTIDFVEFDTEISKQYGHDVTTTNFSAKAYPTIKLTSDPYPEGVWDEATGTNKRGGLTLGNTKNYFSAVFVQKKALYAPFEAKVEAYDNKVPKFASKKIRVFGGAMELGTFVIEANREAYKKAALSVLGKYADYIVAILQSYTAK